MLSNRGGEVRFLKSASVLGFPDPRLPPRPPRFRAPEPLLDAPVGVPIKCPALPFHPPKPRLPDPFQGFQGTRPPAYQP